MRDILLTTAILSILLIPLMSATPDFEKKWEVCDSLNITNNTGCDLWWYNTNFSEMDLKNYSILHDFNITKYFDDMNRTDLLNVSMFYWNKTETLNKTEIETLVHDTNVRINNTLSIGSIQTLIDDVKAQMTTNDNDLSSKIKNSDFNVGWKFAIVLSMLCSLGIAGYIVYELKKQQS